MWHCMTSKSKKPWRFCIFPRTFTFKHGAGAPRVKIVTDLELPARDCVECAHWDRKRSLRSHSIPTPAVTMPSVFRSSTGGLRHLGTGVHKQGPWSQIQPTNYFCKILLECNHPLSLMYHLWLFSCYHDRAEQSWQRPLGLQSEEYLLSIFDPWQKKKKLSIPAGKYRTSPDCPIQISNLQNLGA